MVKIVPFKVRPIVRCRYCNTIKSEGNDALSHRGVDYLESPSAHFWSVFASGWKKVEVIPVHSAQDGRHRRELYYQCADCSKVGK